MRSNEVQDLLYRYERGICTDKEKKAVELWYENIRHRSDVDTSHVNWTALEDRILNSLNGKLDRPVPVRKNRKIHSYYIVSGIAVAATILLFFIWNNRHNENKIIQPGGMHAIIASQNGETIRVEDIAVGKLIEMEDGGWLTKNKEGEVQYIASQNSPLTWREISTPNGGQYKLILPDGSRVMLNAGSKLKYPSKFQAHIRQVELIGEGYFEIAHDKESPFHIKVNNSTVQVLGTKFNIKAYPEDKYLVTTVQEGSVKLSSDKEFRILKASDIGKIDVEGNIDVIRTLDHDHMAWTEGQFRFTGSSMRDIALQIERWYDVKIYLDQGIEDTQFYGLISRTETANQLFEILEETKKVTFEIKGRKIYVHKYANN